MTEIHPLNQPLLAQINYDEPVGNAAEAAHHGPPPAINEPPAAPNLEQGPVIGAEALAGARLAAQVAPQVDARGPLAATSNIYMAAKAAGEANANLTPMAFDGGRIALMP
ncbi:MAG: hypothetical protein LBV23_01265, partial [Deltaproteobacteria bacterium]|nr:hypothetical protein [Deltaproteobacteria bacterium]